MMKPELYGVSAAGEILPSARSQATTGVDSRMAGGGLTLGRFATSTKFRERSAMRLEALRRRFAH